jgi:hypothetical protein
MCKLFMRAVERRRLAAATKCKTARASFRLEEDP